MRVIKYSILGFVLLLESVVSFAQKANDPIVMKVGNKQISKSEFENIYKKNNNNSIDQKSVEEYVDLFVNFKLKVLEAEESGLDTAKNFKNELAGYRRQLAQPYLEDRQVTDKLIHEAYERMKTDVKASHILVPVKDDALPADTLKAYKQALSYKEKVLKGYSFEKLMSEVNDPNPEAAKRKVIAEDLGYFSVFMMVYPFENMAYKTEPGKVSDVVRTKFGYHVLFVHEKRPARGQMKAAHIMVQANSTMSEDEKKAAKQKIDELYAKAKAGESFSTLAQNYSDDRGSAAKGGELPIFGSGRMVAEFEEAAFALKNDGDISEPFLTKFGWHIVERLELKPIGTFEETQAEIKAKITRDGRAAKSKTSFIAKVKKEYGFAPNMKKVEEFYKVCDQTYIDGNWDKSKASKLTAVIFTLEDKTYSITKKEFTQADFAEYLNASQKNMNNLKTVKEKVDAAFNSWVDMECTRFEDANLENKYLEFRALMQEYRDGILLFDLMDKKVWSKAVKDTVGLKEHYEKNKEKFMWEERCNASIYFCSNADIAKQARKLAKKQLSKNTPEADILAELNKDSQLNLKIESGKFLKNENPYTDQVIWSPGVKDDIIEKDRVVFVVVKEKLFPQPKTLKEAKGLVTADYQNYLEKQWIDELRKKYSFEVDREVLSQVK